MVPAALRACASEALNGIDLEPVVALDGVVAKNEKTLSQGWERKRISACRGFALETVQSMRDVDWNVKSGQPTVLFSPIGFQKLAGPQRPR